MWSALWNACAAAIVYGANYVSGFFLGGVAGDIEKIAENLGVSIPTGFGFSFTVLLTQAFWGLIWGAVGGFILAQYYELFHQWNIRYLKGKLNTFFKLLFYPTLVGAVAALLLTGVFASLTGAVPLLIVLVGVVLARLFYALMMVKSVGKFYR